MVKVHLGTVREGPGIQDSNLTQARDSEFQFYYSNTLGIWIQTSNEKDL